MGSSAGRCRLGRACINTRTHTHTSPTFRRMKCILRATGSFLSSGRIFNTHTHTGKTWTFYWRLEWKRRIRLRRHPTSASIPQMFADGMGALECTSNACGFGVLHHNRFYGAFTGSCCRHHILGLHGALGWQRFTWANCSCNLSNLHPALWHGGSCVAQLSRTRFRLDAIRDVQTWTIMYTHGRGRRQLQLRRPERRNRAPPHEHVGICEAALGSQVSTMGRELPPANYLRMLGTFGETGPTHYQSRHTSKIDHITAPGSVRGRVRRSTRCQDWARRCRDKFLLVYATIFLCVQIGNAKIAHRQVRTSSDSRCDVGSQFNRMSKTVFFQN